jgi:hypothetical protein
MPYRGDPWRAEAVAYATSVDLGAIPWSAPRDLMHRWNVFVVGNAASAGFVAPLARAYGLVVAGTGGDPAATVARARGATLVVLAEGGRHPLPPDLAAAWLPPEAAAFLAARGDGARDWSERRHPDGTRVLLVRAEDEAGVTKALSEAFR